MYYLMNGEPSSGNIELLTAPGTGKPISFESYDKAFDASFSLGGQPVSQTELEEMGVEF